MFIEISPLKAKFIEVGSTTLKRLRHHINAATVTVIDLPQKTKVKFAPRVSEGLFYSEDKKTRDIAGFFQAKRLSVKYI